MPIEEIGGPLERFGVNPLATEFGELYGEPTATVHESPWISKSEKERIDDLLLSGSLVILPPQINIAVFREIARNFPDHFSLSALASTAGVSRKEVALIYSALLGNQPSSEELNNALTKKPIEDVLKGFIETGTWKPIDFTHIPITSQSARQFQEQIKEASPSVVDQALKIAQQQAILSFLMKWSKAIEDLNEQKQKALASQEIEDSDLRARILRDEVKKFELLKASLRQPLFSVLFGGSIVDTQTTAAIASILPFARSGGLLSASKALSAQLLFIAQGIITAASTFAAPLALSLMQYGGSSEASLSHDAAESFALTLSTILEGPEVRGFIQEKVAEALARGEITEGKAEILSATFTASLLLTALASLYKANYGGVSAGELKALITGEMKTEETDCTGVLVKLIREQIMSVPEADRERAIDELTHPFDEEVPVDEFTESFSQFISGWDTSHIQDASLATPG